MKCTEEQHQKLLDELRAVVQLMAETHRKFGEEMKTPEYQERVRQAQEEERRRNRGLEPGQNWRDIVVV